ERPPRSLILSERCGDLLAHGQLCELKSPLGRLRLRRCRSDVALIAVAHRQHDAHAGAKVMEDVLDRAGRARAGDTIQVETEVLALIADVDAGVPSTFGPLFANLRGAHRDVGASDVEIGPPRQGLMRR